MHDDSNFMKADDSIHMTKMKESQNIEATGTDDKVIVSSPVIDAGQEDSVDSRLSKGPDSPGQGNTDELSYSNEIGSPKSDKKNASNQENKPIDITDSQL